MKALKTGTIKWFRFDGTGYIIPDEGNKEETILIDVSVLKDFKEYPEKGDRVSYEQKIVLGKRIGVNVTKLNS